ncbi:MAG: S4 domain-containing protein [Candidatus Sedimenticola endophacoides]|uniref:Heat shock protein 15 n=1 Tax=Candidatus Sedimenticola endophacoides TaxID=2548426 RepID=A0A6N4DYT7_9GAMM|nr:MAG: RNA-binding protein S4 [Candidatus Sedimenticola endophacoides]OQX34589.1 MAG: RNA-binding protein S4 [Candidatus Sedimenticola endophacoides]OQX41359.1 MAG: RNA-binding protein S4 [Candidatus Sedimenticola endophacoides]PUE01504.1 MAG: RNA-binding protein S4 [Candidatus Sedimenticola endophacoides]PUE03411.1 MAG: RNA-binding protein S4 [Candidatus Sedimenticola endophacoides]
MSEPGQPTGLRLDKWLWAARFFKTRQLAVEAINGGKVHLNGQRAKPGREVRPGTRLRIHKGSLEWEITVEKIPKQRRPASEAITFYSESEQSRDRREAIMAEEKLLRAAAPRTPESRPNKKQRRMIHRFTRGEE